MSKRPRVKQRTFEEADLHSGAFAAEKLPTGGTVQYRRRAPHDYYYTKVKRTVRFGENDTIVGAWTGWLSLEQAQVLLDWLKSETTWHDTTFEPEQPKKAAVNGFGIPTFEVTRVWVDSKFHRKMTQALKDDLARVEQATATRKAKEREASKKRKAEVRAAQKKSAEALKKRAAAQDAVEEFGDLASALKVLKKHGLKIVTVEEKTKG